MEPNIEKYLPEGGGFITPTPLEVSIISIAISLKRIADEISGIPYNHEPGADNTKHKSGVVDGIMLAIEQGILATRHQG